MLVYGMNLNSLPHENHQVFPNNGWPPMLLPDSQMDFITPNQNYPTMNSNPQFITVPDSMFYLPTAHPSPLSHHVSPAGPQFLPQYESYQQNFVMGAAPCPMNPAPTLALRRRASHEQMFLTTADERMAPCQPVPSSPAKQFRCTFPGCSKPFKRTEHLKRHLNTVHTDHKPYVCKFPECQKRFSRSDNLTQHLRTHRPKQRKNSANF